MAQTAFELNLDGLIGPTHNYGGLSGGNLASSKHRLSISDPKGAALQGLQKMKLLSDLGVKQAVFPPQERPDLATLRRVGFRGSDAIILEQAGRKSPEILAACCSASSVWMANAATVSPGADTADGRVHFTPANLVTQFHRSIEPPTTGRLLKAIFPDESLFVHHPPLPGGSVFCDEGAANHIRLSGNHAQSGVELFVYGKKVFAPDSREPTTFPARQSLEASEAVARLHRLDPGKTIFALQNPDAIDTGVFHNDLVAVGNENLLLFHSLAFSNPESVVDEVKLKYSACSQDEPILIAVSPDQVPLDEAVATYLFNSQIVTMPDGSTCMISPMECQENPRTRQLLMHLVEKSLIHEIEYVDIRQSMKNGGGPACLRLRVVLREEELAAMHQGVLLTDSLYRELRGWIDRFYRDRLAPSDLSDPHLLEESRAALDALTGILKLGSIYPFQRSP